MLKRITIISEGVKPASSNTFDDTKVAPHTMAVNMAMMWYIDFGFIVYRMEFMRILALTRAMARMRLISISLSAWWGFWLTSFT